MSWWSAVPLVGGWVEKGLGARRRRRATDTRIADKALPLRRSLAASLEDWPKGPATAFDFAGWAARLSCGFNHTEAALKELLDLRPDASRKVHDAVGRARDRYYDVANLINPLFKVPAVSGGLPVLQPEAEAPLRKAFAQLRQCLRELESVSRAD